VPRVATSGHLDPAAGASGTDDVGGHAIGHGNSSWWVWRLPQILLLASGQSQPMAGIRILMRRIDVGDA
jgi:hypothetical protein